MTKIQDITKEYGKQLDYFDLEIIIANSLNKTREFVLSHPEQAISKKQAAAIAKLIQRRIQKEPIAHLIGHKEFYGLDFIVNKHTLVPRPETELMVEMVIGEIETENQNSKITIADIGTGSGCIIISTAKTLGNPTKDFPFLASDISTEALKIAKKNAKRHEVDGKIKFLNGNLLSPILTKLAKLKANKLIITANLPYLSKDIYNSAPIDVKKFEPKTALYSPEEGLWHYKELLKQIKTITEANVYRIPHVTCYMEISPEQKSPLSKIVKTILPKTKTTFIKDLAGKWRICKIQTN